MLGKMTQENANIIFKQELYMFAEYDRLLKEETQRLETTNRLVEYKSPSFSNISSTSVADMDYKLIDHITKTDEIGYRIFALSAAKTWITDILNRLTPYDRIIVMHYYMLKTDVSVLAQMTKVSERIVKRNISDALSNIISVDDVRKYNEIQILFKSAFSNEIENGKLEEIRQKREITHHWNRSN